MPDEQQFIYDLFSAIRKDPSTRRRVMKAVEDVDNLTQLLSEGKASRGDVTAAEAEVVRACGFNFGLLMPRFFPRYPVDTPLDFSSRPFMYAMTSLTPGSVIALKAGRQVGKCADGDTEVITDRGPATLASLFDEGEPAATAA